MTEQGISDRFFLAAVEAWRAEPDGIEKLVSTNIRLHCENAERTAEIERLKSSLVRKHPTRSGTPWQSCRVCKGTGPLVTPLIHGDDCPLASE